MKKTFLIKSVLGGHSSAAYFGQKGQFLASVGIDPGLPVSASAVDKPSGAIMPTRYEAFSGNEVNSAPMWIVTNPKNELVYAYLANGRLISYSNTLGSETNIGTPTSGVGNGMAYYDNYIYLATPTDISRYGPLNGSPSLANTYWTSTLSKTALTNTTYPANRNVTFPNHVLHVHYGKLYILDYKDGIGRVHFIQTTKTTVEGDTDNGSTYNTTFALPSGYLPFDMDSYGSDIGIIAVPIGASSPVIKQGKAMLFLWDTFSPKPYRGIELPDAIATAILTHNGIPHIWSGSIEKGVRLSRYTGGNRIETLLEFSEGTPPPAGAVDALGNRVIWGGWGTKPLTSTGVYARGYVDGRLPSGSLNQIANGFTSGTSPVVSALKFVQEGSVQPIIGWRSATNFGISKSSTSASFGGFSIFQSEIVNVGQPFAVTKVRLPLAEAVAANMSIAPSIYVDDLSSSTELTAIATTDFSGKRNAPINCHVLGEHNFMLQLSFTNTAVLPVLLPIEITIETFKD